jgi:hypothetical protein
VAIAPLADVDLVSLSEAVDLLKGTPYPVSESTIRRWLKRRGLQTVRVRGRVCASYSDILEAQRDEYIRIHSNG